MSYLFQPENAIPCLSWYNNKQDRELLRLIPILEKLSCVKDVRNHIKNFVSNNRIDYSKA
jgi:TFIIF-interacting CTD phosphatase-like protein